MYGKSDQNHADNKHFRSVCIGASAGGLEALISFLKFIPKNSNMAFIIIQHLEPQHKSALPEILSRETSLNIREAKNNTRIQPAHCYVIPPNTLIAISHGSLTISSRVKRADGRYLPVDHFMISLSEDQGEKSIGVILSGTGSDGTEGIKAIKSKGGITFAQDEKTARYYGMPGSAIAGGSVDMVLEPKEIAKALAHIDEAGYKRPAKRTARPFVTQNGISPILGLLKDRTGVDFIHYKQTTITRRIARRMAYHEIGNHDDYFGYLEKNPDEADFLLANILIPVTSFFRDPEVFAAMRKKVFQYFLSNRPKRNPIRIWVPACSTGEEVYSIAITLYEFFEEKKSAPTIQIFGTDLSNANIEKARAGSYAEDISSQVSEERLRRFFVKTENGYKIAKHIRDLCIFAKHDITSDPPLSNMDMTSCRNLLIYLDTALQNKVLSILHYAIKPEGFLVLGTSESVGSLPDFFTAVDKKNKIYSKNIVDRKFIHNAAIHTALIKTGSSKGYTVIRKKAESKKTDKQSAPLAPKTNVSAKRRKQKTAGSDTLSIGSTVKDIAKLRKEFARTVERMNAISEEKDTFNEELKAANEEIQSSNEELQSMNEELETAKEELQSTNEELLTLNEELQNKNAELAHLNSDLSNFFTSTNIPIIIVGNDMRIKRFTPTARKVMNLIPTDVDRPIGDIKLNIDIANLEEVIQGVAEDMVPKELDVKDHDGRWYSLRIRPYRTMDNKIDGAIIAMIDIDAIKHSREEIQAALNYSQSIIETIREPLLVLDKDIRVLSANKSFYHTFKVKESGVKNQLLYDLGGRQWDNDELRKLIEEILPKKSCFYDFEVSFDFPDIGQRTMLLNGRHIELPGNGNQMILLVIEDITKRKKADELLKRDSELLEKMVEERSRELLDVKVNLERAKHLSNIGTLAATIAHELRNTLSAIKISAYNIRKKLKDPRIESNLNTIDNKVTESAQIINNVLSYSKIKNSHFDMVRINDIVETSILEAKERILNFAISIRGNLYLTQDIFIEADSVQIKEVFLNIIGNAIDAVNRDTGIIEIESKIIESGVSIIIKDNGEGIDPENIEKITDPFFTTKAKGTGLGLSVCNQILMLHDGTMIIESEKNKGTKVRVTLPLQRETNENNNDTQSPEVDETFINQMIENK